MYSLTGKLSNGEPFRSTLMAGNGVQALDETSKQLFANYTPEEIGLMTELRIKHLNRNPFKKGASTPKGQGDVKGQDKPNPAIVARQAASQAPARGNTPQSAGARK